jgi:hypothetical protein
VILHNHLELSFGHAPRDQLLTEADVQSVRGGLAFSQNSIAANHCSKGISRNVPRSCKTRVLSEANSFFAVHDDPAICLTLLDPNGLSPAKFTPSLAERAQKSRKTRGI